MFQRTTLITGASGFIGAAIVQRLSQLGVPVVGVDKVVPKSGELPHATIAADLTDVHRTYSILKEFDVKHIIHCGGISGSMLLQDNPYAIFETNVLGTMHLLEAARLLGIQRFIYCSSISAYGNTQVLSLAETAGFAPENIYGASKAAGDVLVQAYSHQGFVDGVALRIASVFGPGRQTLCPIWAILMSSLTQKTKTLSGNPHQRRQYIYIDDVVDGVLAAYQAELFKKRAYNIAAPICLSCHDMVEIIKQEIPDIKVEFDWSSHDPPEHETPLAIESASEDLGFHPYHSFQDGVKLYYQWLKCQVDLRAVRH